jgi:hypothetical protein
MISVDLDRPSTWPEDLLEAVESLIQRLSSRSRYPLDLRAPDSAVEAFDRVLFGYPIRALHATRLLEHEVDLIRTQGLRLATAELVRDRIEAAYVAGYVTDADRDTLHEAHVFTLNETAGRKDQVCLFVSTVPLTSDIGAIAELVGTWGGEILYRSSRSGALPTRLKTLGQPAIVEVTVDLKDEGRKPYFAPDLWKLFVGKRLRLARSTGDVHLYAPVPPSAIVRIAQPGDRAYERYTMLPERTGRRAS